MKLGLQMNLSKNMFFIWRQKIRDLSSVHFTMIMNVNCMNSSRMKINQKFQKHVGTCF